MIFKGENGNKINEIEVKNSSNPEKELERGVYGVGMINGSTLQGSRAIRDETFCDSSSR